jgi:hypothetical protein
VIHWLIVALLVSVGVLLLAAAAMARHVLLHRKRQKLAATDRPVTILETHEESDLESET